MQFQPIAIVGQACLLPGANSPEALFEALVAGRDLTSRVPAGRWGLSPHRLLRPSSDQRGTSDAAWSDRGGYVEGFESIFDPTGFAMDPSEVRSLDPLFQWVLHTGREALRDAGVQDTSRTGAIFGNLSFPASGMAQYAERVWLGETRANLAGIPKTNPKNRFMSGLPAHLLAKALSLGEASYCLDAACASSLYAIKLACDALHDGKTDVMLAGAVNRADDLFIHVGFTALNALSKSGQSRPFHPEADGLIPAEGAGFVVLKRLADAERDGDKVVGVIRGVGLSNDGRGSGFLAPSSEGQVRAMRAAYEMSGLQPHDISLVECHATGTTVGDAAELKSMKQVFEGVDGLILGSLKGNMGHPITAAGIAGLLKVLGAMKKRVIPPSRHAAASEQTLGSTAFRLAASAEPWNAEGPRRAALSAFGFGGNNAHLIVEEYRGPTQALKAQQVQPSGKLAIVAMGAQVGSGHGVGGLQDALMNQGGVASAHATETHLAVRGLKFPPRDLKQALGQQLTMLGVTREALEGLDNIDTKRTGVFVGMGCDPAVARYGVRWRLEDWAARWGDMSEAELRAQQDAAVPCLESPGVLGTMPNVVANRLSSQFDCAAQGYTISAEELSGVRALEIGMRALRTRDVDAAVVGAVDISDETVHKQALSELGLERSSGDGAVVLVLERLEDAKAKGRAIYAVLDDAIASPLWAGAEAARTRTGEPHAARGLLEVASLALCLANQRNLGNTPWQGAPSASLQLQGMEGQVTHLELSGSDTPASHFATPTVKDLGPTLGFAVHQDALTFPEFTRGTTMSSHVEQTSPLLPQLPTQTAVQTMAPAPTLAPVSMPAPAQQAPMHAAAQVVPQAQPETPVVVLTEPAIQPAQPQAMGGLMGALLSYRENISKAHIAFASEQARAQAKLMELQNQARTQLVSLYPGQAPIASSPAPVVAAPQPAPVVPAQPAAPQVVESLPVQAPVMAKPAPVTTPTPRVEPQATAPKPVVEPVIVHETPSELPGLKLSREQLMIHADGNISEIFGPMFTKQDGFERQVRMPKPPLLLADRVTGLDAEAGSMGRGTIWTETDVVDDAWYMHEGRMPAGIMIESGQADLMLISYLGVDFLNQSDRVYRLLGCDLTYHGSLPKPGETLQYDIHVDGHAQQGDVRLFFFHYDCCVDGEPRLTVRGGQAGFFTDEELDDSKGIIWDAATGERTENAQVAEATVASKKTSLTRAELEAFAAGNVQGCFGEGFEHGLTHTSTPKIAGGKMLFMDEVTHLEHAGGPWGRGYLRATQAISADDWFFDGHFKNDSCMPGTLMFEGCLQTMAIYMASLGYTLDRDGWRFEPVPEETYPLRCRGQVLPTSKELIYEVFVDEVIENGTPKLYADILCTIDGLKAFHCRRMGLQLTPDWPLEKSKALNPVNVDQTNCASIDGFTFDYASLLACAWGKPSAAFGPMYSRFDSPTRVARLPGPPYHFMSRVPFIDGDIGKLEAGTVVDVEYDIPESVWYFDENGQRTMPFCVFLEAALQPCGWLASFVGSALTTDDELFFRNLDGTGTLKAEVFPACGTLRTRTKITNISQSAGMIIESFDVECYLGETLVYELKTVFGFFPAEALANQKGLDTTEAQRLLLTEPSPVVVDLSAKPERYASGTCKVARDGLLMIDRVTGIWPQGGEHGLGRYRSEKDIDPDAWFFKAHFFQDPVQPGSLGIEAMIQLLQFAMLEQGMDAGFANPRFESLALDFAMSWKYRGQVKPFNNMMQATLDITETGRDEHGVYALATASLWVDGKRIYEASNVGMRIVEGPEPTRDSDEGEVLDPKRDTWLQDHKPTWTMPVLPMMSAVDKLAGAASKDTSEHVVALHDVLLKGWITVEDERVFTVETDKTPAGLKAKLLVDGDPMASARATLSDSWPTPPEPLEAILGEESASPYETGAVFHGPAFQLLDSLVVGENGSSALLRADSQGVPFGTLNQGLLDAVTHTIPHDALSQWCKDISDDQIAYPARITDMHFYGPAPTEGLVRSEVRFDGFHGGPSFPRFYIQLLVNDVVWMTAHLVEALFPKGPIGSAPALGRRLFLRDRAYAEGVGLASHEDGVTVVKQAEVDQSNWLRGTVDALYGTEDLLELAQKEHMAKATSVHPGVLPEALVLSKFDLESSTDKGIAKVWNKTPETLNLDVVRNFWSSWFGIGRWAVEDLYYSLAEKFVKRVVLADPEGLEALKGRSVLYLANHQVGIESLLFSIITSGLLEVPTVTLAKEEHRTTWLGQLIQHCFSYPGVKDPEVMAFFDREDRESLPAIIRELGQEMQTGARSVMVHVEGTRSLTSRKPVEKMTGAFIDMAISIGVPIVPVRFVGGLPEEPLDERIEFPHGLGKQSYWLGSPIEPQELADLPYGERKKRVIGAINALGPASEVEETTLPDPAFEAAVRSWSEETGAELKDSALLQTLMVGQDVCEETQLILDGKSQGAMTLPNDPRGAWLAELARRLLGPRGPEVTLGA